VAVLQTPFGLPVTITVGVSEYDGERLAREWRWTADRDVRCPLRGDRPSRMAYGANGGWQRLTAGSRPVLGPGRTCGPLQEISAGAVRAVPM